MRKMSRRSIVGTLSAIAAAAMGTRANASTPGDLELSGIVCWRHRERGLLMFLPDRPDAGQHLIRLDVSDEASIETLKELRPTAKVVVRLTWRPEIDILAPWQAREIVARGKIVPARIDIANIA